MIWNLLRFKTRLAIFSKQNFITFITFDNTQQVLDGLKEGNEALKKIQNVFSLTEVEKILEDSQDAIAKQNVIPVLKLHKKILLLTASYLLSAGDY